MKKGIQLSFLTACVSGISVFANSVFVSKADPVAFAFVRNLVVALMLTVGLFLFKKHREITKLSKKSLIKLLAIGVVGGGIPFALFFLGLSKIGAVNGTLIHKSMFLWVAVLAVPFLSEALSWITIVGYGLMFAALFLIGNTFKFVPSMGTYMVLAATILWAIEQIIAKRTLTNVSPFVVSWARMVFGLPFLLAMCALFGRSNALIMPSTWVLMPLVASASLLAVYMITWYGALAKAPATIVSSVLVLAPAVTMLIQMAITRKPVSPSQVWPLGIIGVGVAAIIAGWWKSAHRGLVRN